MWALIGESGSGKSTLGVPRPAWARVVGDAGVRWQVTLG
jgi:ABC-type dipeptide/oligopeptide/nickel transport system ATPase component